MAIDGTEQLLYSFSRFDYETSTNADGCKPTAGLTLVGEGDFFGASDLIRPTESRFYRLKLLK